MEKTREDAAPELNNELSEAELDKVIGGSDALNSLSEMNEEQQLKMQMTMDKMTKAYSAASQAAKKISATAQTITQNLK